MKRSTTYTVVALAVLVAACSRFVRETPVETSPEGSGGSSTSTDPEPPALDCIRFTGDHTTPINTGSIATDALNLSGEVFLCANDVVVVDPGNLNEVVAASQLAAALSGPLLFPSPRLPAELGRLDPSRVHVVGAAEVRAPTGSQRISHDIASAVDLASSTLGTNEEVRLPATPDASTVVETVLATQEGNRVVFPQTAPPGDTVADSPHIAEQDVISGLAVPSDSSSIWMVDAAQPETILLASAFARSADAAVVAIDGDGMLANPAVSAALEGRSRDDIRPVGGASKPNEWEFGVLTGGTQVPGGGLYVLPADTKRRYVAFYGHPDTPGLGVLGEQGPADTLARMQPFLKEYAADGAQVIPTFEMMASIAAGSPTDDNDYSHESPIEALTPWVEFAADNDMYVVLDLQSGRDDFLTQAKMYEKLLRLPYVGLALDPEWRLQPDQIHLQQIGSVTAEEVNTVIDWLADLVGDNGLPQKLIIVHQFRLDMIQNRETLEQRPELQLVIQMDGEGGAGGEYAKDQTYQTVTAGTENAYWKWGWKNFFDEDEPGPPPPEHVINKDPVPVYVSYQ